MPRVAALILFIFASQAAFAEDGKEVSCKYQGQVMAAVQQAALDRVKQEDVAATIASSNPTWPAQYSNAIPPLAEQVYSMKRRDLKKHDLGAVLEAQCLQNWDQIQAIKKGLQTN
jgi:hypothetical protein